MSLVQKLLHETSTSWQLNTDLLFIDDKHNSKEYDAPGTVELVVNRKIYRVGQTYLGSPDGKVLYTVSTIQPNSRKAICLKYMQTKNCFACPKGHNNSYILLGEDVILDLALLKVPFKKAFKTFPMKYEQDENQRSFAYYNDTGKIRYHATGRPSVRE